MLTYGMLIRELPDIARDQIGILSARHGVPARDVEAALELLLRRGIARRRRWRDRDSGNERTTWTLISDPDGALRLASKKLIEVDSPLLDNWTGKP